MKVRGVLFDLDGTLVDHESAANAALAGWLPELGVTPDPDVAARWHEIAERHLVAWRAREITFAEQRRRRLRDFLPSIGVEVGDADLDEVFAGYVRWYEQGWRAFDDVADALAVVAAAGVAVAVLTNGATRQQNAKLARSGLAGLVGEVWTPENLGVAKPDPDAFRFACARWGLAPETVLSVGDRHDLDVVPARAAGLRAVLVDRSGAGPADEPDRVRSLRDLPLA